MYGNKRWKRGWMFGVSIEGWTLTALMNVDNHYMLFKRDQPKESSLPGVRVPEEEEVSLG